MAKFSNLKMATTAGPLQTTGVSTVTFEGGQAVVADAKTELFQLAATSMVAENTFYEGADDRDARLRHLIAQVTTEDPAWIREFVPFLRLQMLMRSAAIVVACEYVKAGGVNGRRVIDAACQRADEPGEVIAYWLSRYGRTIPKPVKRGVADAARRLYHERSVLKYDGKGLATRMGDVVELTHPKPLTTRQSALFQHLLDRRHGHKPEDLSELPTIRAARELQSLAEDERRRALRERGSVALAEAGFTWERLAGWLPGGMDAEAWEAIIPNMGYMGLLRNLRNFDEAGVSDEVAKGVAEKLMNPEDVATSRQLPFRFFSAYREVANLAWALPLERALDLSCANVPDLPGRTLVLVDVSGSMTAPISDRSKVERWAVGAVFAGAVVRRSGADRVDLVAFGTNNTLIPVKQGSSILPVVSEVQRARVGHGTETWKAVKDHYDNHDRVVIFTDQQSFGDERGGWGWDKPTWKDAVLKMVGNRHIYAFDLAGYRAKDVETGAYRHQLGGFSDKTFTLMPLLERGSATPWPWE